MIPLSTAVHRTSLAFARRLGRAVVVFVVITSACQRGGNERNDGSASPRPAVSSGAAASETQGIRIVQTLYPLNAYSRLVGHPAPPLDIAHWLCADDGECAPAKAFEPGRVYVVAFWASWCPRCRETLPLLVKLPQRFEPGTVTVVCVSHEDPEDVRRFLSTPDEPAAAVARATAQCCLAADPDESVHRDYMEAVDETGIPMVFLVGREGLIEWIGHPVDMEGPLADIVAGRWDREAFVAIRRKIEGVRARVAAIVEEAGGPRAHTAAAALRAFAAERRDDAADLNEMGWLVHEFAEGKPLPVDLVAEAIAAVARSLEIVPDDANALDTLAHLQAMQGSLDEAIITQTRAVAAGGARAERFAEFLRELQSKQESAAKHSPVRQRP